MVKEILVVEDNPEMAILIQAALDEHEVSVCHTLKESAAIIKKKNFQLIILDLGLPDGDGLKFLTDLTGKPETKDTPIMILSGKSDTTNKVMAFSMGAEDFISKPFDPLELKARVSSKLRKQEKVQNRGELLRIGDLQINIPKQKVWISKKDDLEPVDLTSLEFKILLCFAKAPEIIFSRDNLLNEVWGSDINITDRTVDTHVGHLRKKLSHSKTSIETVVGSGYRFLIKKP